MKETINIPQTITNYFEAKKDHNSTRLAALFHKNAIVIDGGEKIEIRGIEEIKKWIEKSVSGLNLQTKIIHVKFNTIQNEWTIATIVSGEFKASPAGFQYFIQLQNEQISYLRVEFTGSVK